MINEFMKYKFIKKSKSELASDEIVNNLSMKLWKNSGYNIVYLLGIINYLKGMVTAMRDSDYYSKKDLMRLIASFKDDDDNPDEIKSLVDIILEELEEKENNKCKD